MPIGQVVLEHARDHVTTGALPATKPVPALRCLLVAQGISTRYLWRISGTRVVAPKSLLHQRHKASIRHLHVLLYRLEIDLHSLLCVEIFPEEGLDMSKLGEKCRLFRCRNCCTLRGSIAGNQNQQASVSTDTSIAQVSILLSQLFGVGVYQRECRRVALDILEISVSMSSFITFDELQHLKLNGHVRIAGDVRPGSLRIYSLEVVHRSVYAR